MADRVGDQLADDELDDERRGFVDSPRGSWSGASDRALATSAASEAMSHVATRVSARAWTRSSSSAASSSGAWGRSLVMILSHILSSWPFPVPESAVQRERIPASMSV